MLIRWLSWIPFMFLIACGKDTASIQYPSGGTLNLDASVPEDQKKTITADILALADIQFTRSDANDLKILGLSQLTAQTFSGWLSERVKVIVGESYDDETMKRIVRSDLSFNPQVIGAAARERFSEDEVVTVMVNLGSYLYLQGKQSKTLYSLPFPWGEVAITTPRVSVVQIGKGLFNSSRVTNTDVNASVNRYIRTATYSHEGRHGDGNGSATAFPHTKCPEGYRSYTNEYACENYSNGPYVVEATSLRNLYYACTDCSTEGYQALSATLLDLYFRVLPTARSIDARPEGVQ